ncbi:unnamed protein product, partial [Prorocentrum cordatum]
LRSPSPSRRRGAPPPASSANARRRARAAETPVALPAGRAKARVRPLEALARPKGGGVPATGTGLRRQTCNEEGNGQRQNAEWTDEEERAKKVIQRVYSGSGHYLRTWINSALNARKCDWGPSSASETHSRAAHRRASTSRRAAAEHCAAARLPSPRPPRGRALA